MSKEKKIREVLLSIHRLVETAESEKLRLNEDANEISNIKLLAADKKMVGQKVALNKENSSWENINFHKTQMEPKKQKLELLFKSSLLTWYNESLKKTFEDEISKHT